MLGVPDDPYARKIIGWLQDAKRMVKMAEEAISVYGEAEGFLFYLYRGQNWCGNLGKAIKTMEKLAKRFPDKAYYKKELAISYFDRGIYNKKSLMHKTYRFMRWILFCLLPNKFRYAMINKSIFSNYLNPCNCPVFSTVTAKSQFIYRS